MYCFYQIPNHNNEIGNITKISLYTHTRDRLGPHYADVKPALRINNTIYDGNQYSPTQNWWTYSQEWLVNPHTSSNWTWNDIDNLQIGLAMHTSTPGTSDEVYCTQVYLKIDYLGNANPEIRTTQCYIQIETNNNTFSNKYF